MDATISTILPKMLLSADTAKKSEGDRTLIQIEDPDGQTKDTHNDHDPPPNYLLLAPLDEGYWMTNHDVTK